MSSIQPSPHEDEISAVQVRPTAPADVAHWLGSLGQGEVPLLTVKASAEYRQMVFGWCSAVEVSKWQTHGVRNELVHCLLRAGAPIFRGLLTADSFLIQEPLRSMVDQRFYLISDLFRVLLESRFQVAEGSKPEPYIEAISRWILGERLDSKQEKLFTSAGVTRRVQPTEQLDAVFFLGTLAAQSGVIERLTVALDHVERAASAGLKDRRTLLRELDDVAFGATRWERLGSPLGVIIGVEHLPFVEPATKLAKLLRSGTTHQQPV